LTYKSDKGDEREETNIFTVDSSREDGKSFVATARTCFTAPALQHFEYGVNTSSAKLASATALEDAIA
jgi:hypothetical protein